jgi:hypothetical protein
MPSQTQPPPQPRLRAAITVTAMAKAVGMSRTQFYARVRRGVFPPPLFTVATKKPFYPVELQQEILTTRATGLTPSGEFVLFYERLGPCTAPTGRSKSIGSDMPATVASRLSDLGMPSVPREAVRAAIAACYPAGTGGVDEALVVRAVYRHLRRAGSG